MSAPQKILVYRLGSLGDTVMVLPCFNKIKESFPDAELLLLTNQSIHSKAPAVISITGEHFFSRVFEYPVGLRNFLFIIKLISKLRKEKIDLVINIAAARTKKSAIRDRLFFRTAGIKKQTGTPKKRSDFDASAGIADNLHKWEALRLTERMSSLGTINLGEQKYWDFHFTTEEFRKVDCYLEQLKTKKFIALAPGTKMQSKDWGIQNWIRLLKKLCTDFSDYSLIIIGADAEQFLAAGCLEAWNGNGLNACGLLSPRESAIALSKCTIFIGHDSGPMHLAGAVLTPCVAIFSARNIPVQWFPRGENNTIIYHKTDCAGCNLEVCIEEKKKCILSISVDEVFTVVCQKINALESKSY